MALREQLSTFDPANDSPKQFILDLWKKHAVIGELQARGLSQALDGLVKQGKSPVEALNAICASYDKGSLAFANGHQVQPVVIRTLADAPIDLNGKSKIIWLHREGTISEREMRLAAAKHDELGGRDDPSAALLAVGASKAFAVVPDPVVVPPPVPTADELAQLNAAVLASAIAAAAALELPNILEMNAEKALEAVAACDTFEKAAHLEAIESLNPKFDGGRKGVMEEIEKKLAELAPEPPQ